MVNTTYLFATIIIIKKERTETVTMVSAGWEEVCSGRVLGGGGRARRGLSASQCREAQALLARRAEGWLRKEAHSPERECECECECELYMLLGEGASSGRLEH